MKASLLSRVTRRATLAAVLAIAALPCAFAQRPGAPGQPDMAIDAAQRQHVIDGVVRELGKSYVFPEQAKKAEAALRQHQRRGDYDKITSADKLSAVLSEHLYDITRDKHLRLFYSAEVIPAASQDQTPDAQQHKMEVAGMQAQNFGIERIERLPFNIGYLALGAFAPWADARESLAAAMTVVAHTDALIIDLRKNGGGDPETVAQVASYLLDKRTHLNDIYYRQGDRLEEMWSRDKVDGKRFGQAKDVYVLTSSDTFSAAEDFAYSLKNIKRVTVVGETTGGGAHPGDFTRLSPHFSLFVPNGRSISPVTKTDWEGVGVTPDVAVKAGDAFKTAQLAALNKIVAATRDEAKLGRLQARIAKVQTE